MTDESPIPQKPNPSSQASIALPLVVSAHTDPSNANLAICDADCEASLVANHVARRASIAQGKGLMAALGAAYPQLEMKKVGRGICESILLPSMRAEASLVQMHAFFLLHPSLSLALR